MQILLSPLANSAEKRCVQTKKSACGATFFTLRGPTPAPPLREFWSKMSGGQNIFSMAYIKTTMWKQCCCVVAPGLLVSLPLLWILGWLLLHCFHICIYMSEQISRPKGDTDFGGGGWERMKFPKVQFDPNRGPKSVYLY